MSLQDESFPDDFFAELDFSLNSSRGFQFPNHRRRKHLNFDRTSQRQAPGRKVASSPTSTNAETRCKKVSTCSAESIASEPCNLDEAPNESSCTGLKEQPTSMQSTGVGNVPNGRKSNELISSSSPPFKEPPAPVPERSKAASYLDIHKEYTKRRYKHVESKVGQYIATMKAEDKKRRSGNFQRHRSMPESFCVSNGSSMLQADHLTKPSISHSESELHKTVLNKSASSDVDIDIHVDSTEDMQCCTRCKATTTRTELVDKLAYTTLVSEKERIQSYSDYLQSKLDEKIGENMLLKRDVDLIRIELNSCKDKLKRQTSLGALNNYNYGLSSSINSMRSRPSLATLLYCPNNTTKSTQTETIMTTPHKRSHAGGTPIKDANNNMYSNSSGSEGESESDIDSCPCSSNEGKTAKLPLPLALNFSNTIEQDSGEGSGERSDNEVNHQHTNSNSSDASSKPTTRTRGSQQNSRCPSSSDSAIEIELMELHSPKRGHHRAQQWNGSALHSRCEDLIRSEPSSGRRRTKLVTPSIIVDSPRTTAQRLNRRVKDEQHSLGRRLLRIFVPCTRCNEPAEESVMERSVASQCPLLEKSLEGHCRVAR